MKQLLSLVLAGILLVGSTTPACAAEYNQPSPVASVEQTNTATISEISQEVNRLALTAPPSFYEENNEVATVEDFLRMFFYCNRYIQETIDGFVYPAGDSMWMSAAEWTDLMNRLDEPISLDEVHRIVEKTIECNKLLSSHNIPDTPERYMDVLNAFYGEFSSLAKENPKAIEYWVGVMCDGSGIYNPGRFSSVIHETAHEVSARSNNCFLRRSYTTNAWKVFWARKPSAIYPFDPQTGKNTRIQMQSIPTFLSLVPSQDIPTKVQDTSWYEMYFNTPSIANNYGVYGMLEEFCATSIDIRCDVISSSIRYHFSQKFYEDCLQGYYFWDGAIGSYLSKLKEKAPVQYKNLMANKAFVKVLADVSSYIKNQMALVDITPTTNEDVIALREWSEDVGLHLFLPSLPNYSVV